MAVIAGKCPNQRRRRIRLGGKMVRQLNPGFQLNHGNDGFEYIVEQLDLFLRMTTRPGDEQIGDTCECP